MITTPTPSVRSGELQIVDGQQRLTSLYCVMKGKAIDQEERDDTRSVETEPTRQGVPAVVLAEPVAEFETPKAGTDVPNLARTVGRELARAGVDPLAPIGCEVAAHFECPREVGDETERQPTPAPVLTTFLIDELHDRLMKAICHELRLRGVRELIHRPFGGATFELTAEEAEGNTTAETTLSPTERGDLAKAPILHRMSPLHDVATRRCASRR